eukprot:8104646-Pyramimonas_sp.AAC.1
MASFAAPRGALLGLWPSKAANGQVFDRRRAKRRNPPRKRMSLTSRGIIGERLGGRNLAAS